jgi:hypothetical protein
MSRRDSDLPLHQMLDHAREAIKLSEGRSSGELVDDRVLGLAIVRLMEIVGEAANRVPLGAAPGRDLRGKEVPGNPKVGQRVGEARTWLPGSGLMRGRTGGW